LFQYNIIIPHQPHQPQPQPQPQLYQTHHQFHQAHQFHQFAFIIQVHTILLASIKIKGEPQGVHQPHHQAPA